MFKPELYQSANAITRKDAQEALENNVDKMKWGSGDTIIDLGCGDGSVTADVLKSFLPEDFEQLIGCDVSAPMVQFARARHADARTGFLELDVAGALPQELAARFHHAFSFYAIHWMRDQESTFTNIHKLLKPGGDCLLVFVGCTPVYDIYRLLAKRPTWRTLFKNIENYISPYQDSQDPKKEVKRLMLDVGFQSVDVKCEKKTCVYGLEYFKRTMDAINPIEIPAELQAGFMEDYVRAARELELVAADAGGELVRLEYTLLVAYGSK